MGTPRLTGLQHEIVRAISMKLQDQPRLVLDGDGPAIIRAHRSLPGTLADPVKPETVATFSFYMIT